MREVTLSWDREALAHTSMAQLDEVVDRLSIMGNLLITPEGVRQIVVPSYRAGKSVEDLTTVDFIDVEQVVNERDSDALVVWNTHPLVCLASSSENVHILVPCDFVEGGIDITIRGLPKAVASFVRLSKAVIPPGNVRVRDISEQKNDLAEILTQRQLECFQLAGQHGYYDEPKELPCKPSQRSRTLHAPPIRSTFNRLNKPSCAGFRKKNSSPKANKPLMKAATSPVHGQGRTS